MVPQKLVETLEETTASLTARINIALAEINGKEHLPLWLEEEVNGPISSISADTLQGIKIGMKAIIFRAKEILEEEENDRSASTSQSS